jgi:hypothetical protein
LIASGTDQPGLDVDVDGSLASYKAVSSLHYFVTETKAAIDPITGLSNTWIDLTSTMTATEGDIQWCEVTIIPMNTSAITVGTKRLWARAKKLTTEMLALKQQIRMLETDDQKERIADGTAFDEENKQEAEDERQALDRADALERKHHRRSLGPAINVDCNGEVDDRKKGVEHVAGVGNGNKLNLLQSPKGPVRPIGKVADQGGRRIWRLGDDELDDFQSDQELFDFAKRESQRAETASVHGGVDAADRAIERERTSEKAGQTISQPSSKGSSRK